ncbi:MAG: Coenzyme F420 hydrogenase/dehydrogenase, beta subunit C-terminal domain [Syntrophales bacterium]
MSSAKGGSKNLLEDVIDAGFCTGCGACVTGCPYIVVREGRVVVLDRCTIEEGDCYRHCPRTSTDMNVVSDKVFGVPFSSAETGHALTIAMARSADNRTSNKAQDGGCVTALLAFALAEGMIDAVVCTRMDEEKVPHGFIARSRDELLQCAGSSYEAGFAIEAFRKIPADNVDRLAAVGVGCQVEALAKMKASLPVNGGNPARIQLTVGLFCGWSLRSDYFRPLLKEICNPAQIVKFDIPHSPHTSFDVYTQEGRKSVALDEIRAAINPACQYCWDMTAEFSDISVGSAGSKFPGWNTIVIRTEKGAGLVARARDAGLVEIQSLPEWRLSQLKTAALNRKKAAFKKLAEKSGDRHDLLYISGLAEGFADSLLEG